MHTRPVKLPAPVNTSAVEVTPFAAPDVRDLLRKRQRLAEGRPDAFSTQNQKIVVISVHI
jgi:hypothetical protein